MLSHFMFRTSNWQKFAYKKQQMKAIIWGKKPQLLNGKILISGFWGVGRHLNYTGEILTYFTISLCSGFNSWVPYILPFSLLILLLQRSYRDEMLKKIWNTVGRI